MEKTKIIVPATIAITLEEGITLEEVLRFCGVANNTLENMLDDIAYIQDMEPEYLIEVFPEKMKMFGGDLD